MQQEFIEFCGLRWIDFYKILILYVGNDGREENFSPRCSINDPRIVHHLEDLVEHIEGLELFFLPILEPLQDKGDIGHEQAKRALETAAAGRHNV
ncbi:putative ATPase with chaperone activity [Robertmurraya andreesenii]|uniref:ATPase with chaperone activity n=1 Tax=Anoxybacillus andreesenii TaxID=1325932 RepID=A0ABT9V9S1_9BACL|nr:putative ATPase with chaperone activity [Robertmurraya andreesenii]